MVSVQQEYKNMNLVQIGTNKSKDDFLSIVKSLNKKDIKNLILVEPLSYLNSIIENCYLGFDYKIENLVITDDESKTKVKFFISSRHDWLSSISKKHIEKHIGNVELKEKEIGCLTLNNLFKKHNLKKIDILFIDAEGFDDKLIMSIDFDYFDIEKIYYEDVHIDNDKLKQFLINKGYTVNKTNFKDNLTSLATKL